MTDQLVFIGTITRGDPPGGAGKGIAVARFEDATGALRPVDEVVGIDNPHWISLDRARRRLYAASEVGEWNEGTVSAYEYDRRTGRLVYLSKQPTLGNTTCHLGLSPDGRWLAATNYASTAAGAGPDQSVALLAIGEGGLSPAVGRARHSGTGPNPERQERPHAHCALFTRHSRLLLVTDLGIDRLVAYLVGADGTLMPRPELDFAFAPGRGPRHAILHPDGRTILVDHELDPGVTVLRLEEHRIAHVASIDIAHSGVAYPSAIALAADGGHAYVALRGPGEIVGLALEAGGRPPNSAAGRAAAPGRATPCSRPRGATCWSPTRTSAPSRSLPATPRPAPSRPRAGHSKPARPCVSLSPEQGTRHRLRFPVTDCRMRHIATEGDT